MNQFGLSRRAAVIELNPAGGNGLFLIFHQEHKHRVSGRNLVSMPQPLFLHRPAINQGSIAAVQVLDLKTTVFLAAEHAVFSGDRYIRHGHGIGGIAADRGFSAWQRNGRVLRGSGDYQESRAQSGSPSPCRTYYHSAEANACPM